MENYAMIPLTQGQFAIVDTTDYEWLSQWKWFAQFSPPSGQFYACRRVTVTQIQMHRVILGLSSNDFLIGDHINGDTLDNRRCNLRAVSAAQNSYNAKITKQSLSGVKGVTPRFKNGKQLGTYRAYIYKDYQRIDLGSYPTMALAIEARKNAERRLFGEFARGGDV